MTDKQDLIREIHEYVTTHGGENTATHLLVQAASAIQTQAAELEAVGAGGVQALSAGPEAAPRIFLVTEHYSKDGRLKPVYGSSLRKILSGHSTLNSAECARAEAEDAYNVLYPGYRQYGNPLPYAWVVQEVEVMPNTASPTPPAEQPIDELVVTKTRDGQIVSVTRQDDEGRILSVIATSDPAEQQAAPEAAPGEQNESAYQRGYMDGMAKGRRDAEAAPQQEAQEPIGWTTGIAWRSNTRLQSEQVVKITRDAQPKYGYTTPLYTAPQPAPAPLSDDVSQKTWALLDELEKLRGADRYDEDWVTLNKRDDELRAALAAQKDAP